MNKFLFTFILLLCQYLSKSQDYIGIAKDQIISIKGSNYQENVEYNVLTYKVSPIIGDEAGRELFYFDKSNIVTGFAFLKDIYKADLLNLIKYNNSNYQARNSGVKGEMQWVDIRNRIEISLKTKEWTDNVSFIIYKVFIMK